MYVECVYVHVCNFAIRVLYLTVVFSIFCHHVSTLHMYVYDYRYLHLLCVLQKSLNQFNKGSSSVSLSPLDDKSLIAFQGNIVVVVIYTCTVYTCTIHVHVIYYVMYSLGN